MKKIIFILLTVLILMTCGCDKKNNLEKTTQDTYEENSKDNMTKVEKNSFVSYNGALQVNGINLQNQYGEDFRLMGISSHGIQWYGDLVNYDTLKELRDNWNINVFRIAMYTEEEGYIQNNNIKYNVINIIEAAIKLDMYVIVDWHILSDNDPNIHIEEAKQFFSEIASLYHDKPNIIYEICNEPNGENVNWNNDIKPYAETIISTIRQFDEDAIIIVGTPDFCKDFNDVITNQLNRKNIMYALHFYAGTHNETLMDHVKLALEANVPIFVSEWGTSSANGNDGVFVSESEKWFDFLDSYNISWVNWSLTDKVESSAILQTNTGTLGIFDDNYLSESGKYIKSKLKSNS